MWWEAKSRSRPFPQREASLWRTSDLWWFPPGGIGLDIETKFFRLQLNTSAARVGTPSCRGVLFLHCRMSGIRWAAPSWPEAAEANESWNEPGAGMLGEGKWMDLGEWLLQGASPRQPPLIVWAIMLAQWEGWMLGRHRVAWMRPYWLFKLLTWSMSPSWYKDRTRLKWIYINHRANSIRKFQKAVTAKDMRTLLKDQQAEFPQLPTM